MTSHCSAWYMNYYMWNRMVWWWLCVCVSVLGLICSYHACLGSRAFGQRQLKVIKILVFAALADKKNTKATQGTIIWKICYVCGGNWIHVQMEISKVHEYLYFTSFSLSHQHWHFSDRQTDLPAASTKVTQHKSKNLPSENRTKAWHLLQKF